MADEKDGKSFVPSWDGKADSFAHFIVECKWSLQSSKPNERPLLAARIVRKALQSPHSALVQLMYKLRPEDFKSESDVSKLIKYLEESPLNKQPLPDAGSKIGGYYRRLHRKPNESVNSFLIREDKLHDDMLRALQRLLREKELTFDGYQMTLQELKNFCGIPQGQSLYFGEPEGLQTEDEMTQDEEKTETPPSSRHGRPFSTKSSGKGGSSKASDQTSEAGESRRGKDVLERLMEKGLMPLAVSGPGRYQGLACFGNGCGLRRGASFDQSCNEESVGLQRDQDGSPWTFRGAYGQGHGWWILEGWFSHLLHGV